MRTHLSPECSLPQRLIALHSLPPFLPSGSRRHSQLRCCCCCSPRRCYYCCCCCCCCCCGRRTRALAARQWESRTFYASESAATEDPVCWRGRERNMEEMGDKGGREGGR